MVARDGVSSEGSTRGRFASKLTQWLLAGFGCLPGTPSPFQGNEEEVPPEKEDGVRSSQKGEWGQLIYYFSMWKG